MKNYGYRLTGHTGCCGMAVAYEFAFGYAFTREEYIDVHNNIVERALDGFAVSRVMVTAVVPSRIRNHFEARCDYSQPEHRDELNLYNMLKYLRSYKGKKWVISKEFINRKTGNAVVHAYYDITAEDRQ